MTDYTAQIAAMSGPQLVEMWNEMVATAHELGVPNADELREVTRFATILAARTRCAALHQRIEDQRAAMKVEDTSTRASGTVKTLEDEYAEGYEKLRGPSKKAPDEGVHGDDPLGNFDADDSGAQVHQVVNATASEVLEPSALGAGLTAMTHDPMPDNAVLASVVRDINEQAEDNSVPPANLTPAEHTQAVVAQAVVAQVKARAASVKKAPTFTMNSTITPADANPYEEGTERHDIFAKIRAGMTVREFCADHGKYPRALNFLNPLIREGAVTLKTPTHGVMK